MDFQNITYGEFLNILLSGCRFRYISYDHKKALDEYKTSSLYTEACKFISNPDSASMPPELKDKYKLFRVGKLRSLTFTPDGQVYKIIIGNKYYKTFYRSDFGVNVFPI